MKENGDPKDRPALFLQKLKRFIKQLILPIRILELLRVVSFGGKVEQHNTRKITQHLSCLQLKTSQRR